MASKKKSSARVSVSENPLQAILMADSFNENFIPITLDRPKVLFPLVNVPMIHYTLHWLQSTDVKEVFVFCRAHSNQVITYLEKSEWFSQPNFTVTTIVSKKAESVGDALREIFERNVIEETLKFEEMCSESAKEFAPLFSRICLSFTSKILHYMYNEDIVKKDAILRWEDEKKEADESIQRLREALEEDDDKEN